MNMLEDNDGSIELRELDRLVAGDLAEPERRQLLLKLDAQPDGWRRCALAFLEDQTWRDALKPAVIHSEVPGFREAAKPSRKPFRLGRLAVAASIAGLIFYAGVVSGGGLRRTTEVSLNTERPSPITETISARSDQVREVGWIDLIDDSQGEQPPTRVPIVSGPGLDEQWLRDQAPALPDYVRALWERQGYHLQERRNLVSVTLQDGRRVSIPVDEVDVDYVGQQPL